MARDSMDVTSFVGKLLKEDDSDILRDGITALTQMIIDVEVRSKIGAVPHERTEHRSAYRNGFRTPAPGTLGSAPSSSRSPRSPPAPISLPCSIPASVPRKRCRPSSSKLMSRGSPRKVDDLMRALSIDGISKSEGLPYLQEFG